MRRLPDEHRCSMGDSAERAFSLGGRREASSRIRRSLGYLGRWPGLAVGALGSLLAGSGLALAAPWILRLLIDRGLVSYNLTRLALFSGAYLLVELSRHGADFLQSVLLSKLGHRSTHELRKRIFSHLQRVSTGLFDAHSRGEIVTLLMADTATVGGALSAGAIGILRDLLVFLGTAGALILLNWKFGGLTVIAALVLGSSAVLFRRHAESAAHQGRAALGIVNELLDENLAGAEVIRLYGLEERRRVRFREASESLCQASIISLRTRSMLDAGAALSAALAMTLVIGLGGAQMAEHSLSPGTWLVFVQYVPFLLGGVGGVADKAVTIRAGLSAGRRVFEILDLPEAVPALPGIPPPDRSRGGLEVSGLRFGYHKDREVLKGVTTAFQPGKHTALVGRSGAGKTTLARLLARFYDPWEGMIAWEGRDLRTLTLAERRKDILLVTQDVDIFSGTLLENIGLGSQRVGRSEVLDACRMVGLDAVAGRLEKGFDAVLTRGGHELSAGERHLVSFTRALVRAPRVLILDEPTASVDARGEDRMQKALRALFMGRTVIIIAHRFSMLRDLSRILVMESGTIAEEGTAEELVSKQGLFFRMAELQSFGQAKWTQTWRCSHG